MKNPTSTNDRHLKQKQIQCAKLYWSVECYQPNNNGLNKFKNQSSSREGIAIEGIKLNYTVIFKLKCIIFQILLHICKNVNTYPLIEGEHKIKPQR